MRDSGVALARRLYLHAKDGGSVTAMDLSWLVAEMEKVQRDLDLARSERDRLATEHSKAQLAILPWIEQVGHLNAAHDIHTAALRRIGMPGKEIGYCRDGHEMAVLIAREALKGGEV